MTPAIIDDVTVAIPTIGRIEMLESCLASIRANSAHPAEVLLLDQSDGSEVVELARAERSLNVRVERCTGRGIARNMNLGLRSARTEAMLVTHDDCTVASNWVEVGSEKLGQAPGGIVSGRVMGGGPTPELVPSTIEWDEAYDFTGSRAHGALYPNNMGLHCAAALDIGGFDERPGFATAAEDLDFSYRWLSSGGVLRYEPEMVVTHNDWRSPEALAKLYRNYARSAGRFYGKHLAHGDRVIARQMMSDLALGCSAWVERFRSRSPRWSDERLELPVWMPVGVIEGVVDELKRTANDKAGAK